ncbi:MAG TPA: hypothetical protein VGB85_24830 [Nannocystis sp.]
MILRQELGMQTDIRADTVAKVVEGPRACEEFAGLGIEAVLDTGGGPALGED